MERGITIARSNFLPKLYFSTDYSFMAMRNDLNISQNDFSKGLTSALSLQIPLFSGFRSTRQYQAAQNREPSFVADGVRLNRTTQRIDTRAIEAVIAEKLETIISLRVQEAVVRALRRHIG